MQRRDVLKQLSALAVLGGVGLPALAQPVGYELVAPPQPTEAKGKVEVLEFFHYGCPHCKSFDPLLELWVKKLPADVVFVRVPVTWGNPQLIGLAKLFLTLETTGDHARLHGQIFDAVQSEKLPLHTEAGAQEWAEPPRPAAEAPEQAPALSGKALDVEALEVHFPVRKGLFRRVVGHVKAVDGVSLQVPAGQTLALVGESGCGKTTAGKALLQLVPASGGRARYGGQELLELSPREWQPLRRELQMIFQDPFSSLNPRMRVGEILEEGIRQRLGVLLPGLVLKLPHPHAHHSGHRQSKHRGSHTGADEACTHNHQGGQHPHSEHAISNPENDAGHRTAPPLRLVNRHPHQHIQHQQGAQRGPR